VPGTDHALVPGGDFGPLDELSDRAHQHYVDGWADRAVDEARRWQPLARAWGDSSTHRYLLYTEAVALLELGRYEDSIAAARALLGAVGPDDGVWRAKALAMVAEASSREGQHSRAMSALAEADWCVRTVPPGSYGHLSASMAVALALRSLTLFEQADERLRAPLFRSSPTIHLHAAHELASLSVTWAASLELVGRPAEAARRLTATAEQALVMQRLASELGDPALQARGVVFEAYAMLRLGEVDLAAARTRVAAERFSHRPELLETQLARLVLAAGATQEGDFATAQTRLEAVVADATATGREVWLGVALEALAEVDVARHGETPAVGIWRGFARAALVRLWEEREGRFEALQDRDRIRRLTAETDRMGRVVLQDPLTGLGNRRLLAATLETSARPRSVVFVDIDHFKEVNDRWSHAVGDEVLRRVAHVLTAQCRTEDVVVRYGGDEFVVLTAGGPDRADAVAARVHRAIKATDWHDIARDLTITVSVGVGHADGRADALTAADDALLAAKRRGRDRVVGTTDPSPLR
jgi:diguanylate cyclase (GGDEF)-like protein